MNETHIINHIDDILSNFGFKKYDGNLYKIIDWSLEKEYIISYSLNYYGLIYFYFKINNMCNDIMVVVDDISTISMNNTNITDIFSIFDGWFDGILKFDLLSYYMRKKKLEKIKYNINENE